MSTVAEIEEAIVLLPVPEQQELYRQLRTRLASNSAPAAASKREAVDRFLRRWTGAGVEPVSDEILQEQRTARLIEKHLA